MDNICRTFRIGVIVNSSDSAADVDERGSATSDIESQVSALSQQVTSLQATIDKVLQSISPTTPTTPHSFEPRTPAPKRGQSPPSSSSSPSQKSPASKRSKTQKRQRPHTRAKPRMGFTQSSVGHSQQELVPSRYVVASWLHRRQSPKVDADFQIDARIHTKEQVLARLAVSLVFHRAGSYSSACSPCACCKSSSGN